MTDTTKPGLRYYYEDLYPGRQFHYAPREVHRQEIVAFSTQFNPHFRHNEEGECVADPWHVAALMMRMFYDAMLKYTASQGAPGIDVMNWHRPVIAGDILSGTTRVIDCRELKSRPGIGLLKISHEVVNQRGELVLSGEHPGMVLMRQDRREVAS